MIEKGLDQVRWIFLRGPTVSELQPVTGDWVDGLIELHRLVPRVGVDHGVDASERDGWSTVSFGLKIEQWGEQGTSLVRKRVTVGQIFRGISRNITRLECVSPGPR